MRVLRPGAALTISLAAARRAAIAAPNNEVNFQKEVCLARDRGGDGPHLDFRAAGFLRHIKQNLAAAQINGSRPFAHTKDRLLAEARDRLIFKSQLTPGLDAGLYRCALVNIIVYCSRTR